MKTKKALSLLLALCLVLALLAGCGGGQQTSADRTPATQAPATQAPATAAPADNADQGSGTNETPDNAEVELPAYKIGIISHTNSGGCWDRILDHVTYVANALNCEVSAAVGSSPDQILTETENFIAAGVDGLIVMNDGGVTSRLVDLCESAGVYLAFSDAGYSITGDADYGAYKANPYYVGNVAHDEYADAYACVEDMLANGAENFVIFGLPPGIAANFDKRATGAEAAITDAGLEYVEARSFALPEIANNLMTQYPDTDAIFSFVTTPDSFNVPMMVANYGGKIQISAYMVGDVTEEFETGFLTHVSTGSEARIELAFALLYNALRGDRLAAADGTAPMILFPHRWIKSADEWKTFYAATTGGNHAYDIDEIKQLITAFNPGASVADYETIAADFSQGWLDSKK